MDDKAHEDPAAELAATLARLSHSTRKDEARFQRTERNRLNLLIVHAVAAIVIAPLFMASASAMTGPLFQPILLKIPYFPYSFGSLMFVGGMILLPAAILKVTRYEMLGLGLISAWYTILGVGFGWPALLALHRFLAHEPQPPGHVSVYAWAVYLHLAIIMRIHIFTLWRMLREGRGPTSPDERELCA